MDEFREQSIRFETQVITETISKIDLSARPFRYWREGQESEEPETASGISACAVCDGAVPIFGYFDVQIPISAHELIVMCFILNRNKSLAVISGGDSAAEEATYLTKYDSHVYVLVRRGKLCASKIMAKRLMSSPKIAILWNTVAVGCRGDGDLFDNLRIKNVLNGDERDLPVSGLFYAIGHEPATALVRNQLQTDEDGYIVTVPGSTQTSVKGVFRTSGTDRLSPALEVDVWLHWRWNDSWQRKRQTLERTGLCKEYLEGDTIV
ncbi:hypothetical protein BKA83DRAFT_4498666 [Pisolithus microcarpus]|nr:hypothetical protein BKA83DRAFT_4498666 [Pisolithus microcarpus]